MVYPSGFTSHLGLRQLSALEARCALLTVPKLADAGLLAETNAREVEPFILADHVIARDHVAVAHIVTEAVGWLLAWASRYPFAILIVRGASAYARARHRLHEAAAAGAVH